MLNETSTERKDIKKLSRFDIEYEQPLFRSNEDKPAYRLLQDVRIKSNRNRVVKPFRELDKLDDTGTKDFLDSCHIDGMVVHNTTKGPKPVSIRLPKLRRWTVVLEPESDRGTWFQTDGAWYHVLTWDEEYLESCPLTRCRTEIVLDLYKELKPRLPPLYPFPTKNQRPAKPVDISSVLELVDWAYVKEHKLNLLGEQRKAYKILDERMPSKWILWDSTNLGDFSPFTHSGSVPSADVMPNLGGSPTRSRHRGESSSAGAASAAAMAVGGGGGGSGGKGKSPRASPRRSPRKQAGRGKGKEEAVEAEEEEEEEEDEVEGKGKGRRQRVVETAEEEEEEEEEMQEQQESETQPDEDKEGEAVEEASVKDEEEDGEEAIGEAAASTGDTTDSDDDVPLATLKTRGENKRPREEERGSREGGDTDDDMNLLPLDLVRPSAAAPVEEGESVPSSPPKRKKQRRKAGSDEKPKEKKKKTSTKTDGENGGGRRRRRRNDDSESNSKKRGRDRKARDKEGKEDDDEGGAVQASGRHRCLKQEDLDRGGHAGWDSDSSIDDVPVSHFGGTLPVVSDFEHLFNRGLLDDGDEEELSPQDATLFPTTGDEDDNSAFGDDEDDVPASFSDMEDGGEEGPPEDELYDVTPLAFRDREAVAGEYTAALEMATAVEEEDDEEQAQGRAQEAPLLMNLDGVAADGWPRHYVANEYTVPGNFKSALVKNRQAQASSRRRSVAWHRDESGGVLCSIQGTADMPGWYLDIIKQQREADPNDFVVEDVNMVELFDMESCQVQ